MSAIEPEVLRWLIFPSSSYLPPATTLCYGLLVSGRYSASVWPQTLIRCSVGWSYATYSQFHRWSARIATLLAIAHGSGYSIMDGWQGRYETAWSHQFWYCGAIVSLINYPSCCSKPDRLCRALYPCPLSSCLRSTWSGSAGMMCSSSSTLCSQ